MATGVRSGVMPHSALPFALSNAEIVVLDYVYHNSMFIEKYGNDAKQGVVLISLKK